MGSWAIPVKYTMVMAENEEESPWDPLHVEYGFKKEDSTIGVAFPQRLHSDASLMGVMIRVSCGH